MSFDAEKGIVELKANAEYWGGGPAISQLHIKSIPDPKSVEVELREGKIDLIPFGNYLLPEALAELGQHPNLRLHQFQGSNILIRGDFSFACFT